MLNETISAKTFAAGHRLWPSAPHIPAGFIAAAVSPVAFIGVALGETVRVKDIRPGSSDTMSYLTDIDGNGGALWKYAPPPPPPVPSTFAWGLVALAALMSTTMMWRLRRPGHRIPSA